MRKSIILIGILLQLFSSFASANDNKLSSKDSNHSPVAKISCSTNQLLVSCSALDSVNNSGRPLSYRFLYGDRFSESNTTGVSTHTLKAGIYHITLTVTNYAGATSSVSTQVQTTMPANKQPEAVLNCFSNEINTLTCDANGSIDPDGRISSYEYNWNDNSKDYRPTSERITHVFNTSGEHSVTLTVGDFEGSRGILTKKFVVIPNTSPIPDFSCENNNPLQLYCTSNSKELDARDNIKSYTWKFGTNSFSTHTTSAKFDFKSAGMVDVSLSVKDYFGGVGAITKTVEVKQNIAPVASLYCSNSDINTIHCKSISWDEDGLITSTKWTHADGKVFESIDHKFLKGEIGHLTLTVTDNMGATNMLSKTEKLIYENVIDDVKIDQKTKEVTNNPVGTFQNKTPIANKAPFVNFLCDVSDQRYLKCKDASIDDGEIKSWKWTFENQVFTGTIQKFSLLEDKIYNVALEVEDNFGVKTSIAKFFEMEPSKVSGNLRLVPFSGKGPFFPVSSDVEFIAENIKLKKDTSLNSVVINGSSVDKSKVIYNFENHSIKIKSTFIDGNNEISLLLYDENGKEISKDFIIFAGSRTIQQTFIAEDGKPIKGLEIKMINTENKEDHFSFNSVDTNFTLDNVPDMDFFIHALSADYSGNDILFSKKNNSVITLHSYGPVSTNYDFSEGLTELEVKDSAYSFKSNGFVLGVNKLGRATLRKTIKAPYAQKFVGIPFQIYSRSSLDYIILSGRNKNTGELKTEFYLTSDLGLGDEFGSFTSSPIELPIFAKNVGDIIEVEVLLLTNEN